MKKKYIVTWDELQIYARKLTYKLIPADQWKGIIAVTRGGLVPATIIARELGILYIETICISSYYDTQQHDVNIIKKINCDDDGNKFIIIDDLVDTGETAKVIRKLYPKARFVTIFAKPDGRDFVDNYVKDVKQDIWIELPWDMHLCYIEPISRFC